MSNAQQRFNAGQAPGKTEEWMESARDSTNAARGQSAARGGGQQQQERDQSVGGSVQQTREQPFGLGQDAIDAARDSHGAAGHRNQRN